MSRQADIRYSKSTIVLAIVAASSYLCAVAGFGVFHTKILRVDLNTSSRCSDRKDSSCKVNDTSCGNYTVAFRACLSHHQLPLPMSPKCTFGREVLSLDANNSDHQWKPEALMSLPFNFSWPGGFTLSVTASWVCPSQDSTDGAVFSRVTIADHIFPSSQWTAFKHPPTLTGRSQFTSHSQTSPYTELVSEPRNTNNKALGRDSLSSSSSLGIMYKLFHINSSRQTSNEVDPVEKYAPDIPKEADSIPNDHDIGNIHTTSARTNILAEKLEISRTNVHRGSNSVEEAVTSASDKEADSSGVVLHLKDAPVVRRQGSYMEFAVRVVCTENYYGYRCSQFCRPRNDLLGHYRCSPSGQHICLAGWRGVDCAEAVCSERCLPSRGTCTSPHTCSCRQGWFGEHCDRCRTYPGCKHGTCHLPGQCVCHKGWSGPLCDVEELFCLEHKPCQNGGTCLHDASFNYTCNCPTGYTGTHCEVPLCHNNFCLHGGLCQIAEGTRYCLCQAQYSGPRCQHRLMPSTSNLARLPACSNASCTSDSQKPTSCLQHQCYNKGTCVEASDSQTVQCQCPFPFTGSRCSQVQDPCQSNPCLNGATCKTTDPLTGSFVCDCDSGYFGNVCGSPIPASRNTVCNEHVICENGGTCEKSQRGGQYFCKCLAEFTGEFCEIVKGDGCSVHACLNGGTCVLNLQNEPACACERGYKGLFCQDIVAKACSSVICQNGGTCLEHNGGFVCGCRHKFEGIFCEKRVRRRETTIIVVETPAVRNDRLEVNVESTFKSTAVHYQTHIWILLSTSLGIWIVFHTLS